MNFNFKEKDYTSFLLGIIAASLVVLCISQIRAVEQNQKNHNELYKLIGAHFGHAVSVDLKHEGRFLAFANHFLKQQGENELSKHNPEETKSYLSLMGAKDIIKAAKDFASQSELYKFQLALRSAVPTQLQRLNNKQNELSPEEEAKSDVVKLDEKEV